MHLTMLNALLSAENTRKQLHTVLPPQVVGKLGMLCNTCRDIMVGRGVALVVRKSAVVTVERQQTDEQTTKIRFALVVQTLLHDTRNATVLENRLLWLRRELMKCFGQVSRCLSLHGQFQQSGSKINLAHMQNNTLRALILDARQTNKTDGD